jgi:hypothetical protein
MRRRHAGRRRGAPGAGEVMALFEMQVKDTFRLGERMTAFVGAIESEAKFIPGCDCNIIVDGEVRGSIRIDGETIE